MLRSVRAALLVAVLALAEFMPGAVTAQNQPYGDWATPIPFAAWKSLGPPGDTFVESLGVSSAWPRDPFLIARLKPDRPTSATGRTMRTFDGGQAWEETRVPAPGAKLTVILRDSGERVILALPGTEGAWDPAVFRSADNGRTWDTVAELPRQQVRGRRPPRLVASPSVETDGLVLLIADGELRSSPDTGATWTDLDPSPGQLVQDVVFSPDFSTDHTIFAVVTAEDYPSNESARVPDVATAATVSERSVGIVRSRDGGTTWQPMSAGLTFEGASFRLVESVTISPTFAVDSTLFASGWETYSVPLWNGRPSMDVRVALFRSRDRGESWQVIHGPDPHLTEIQQGTRRERATIVLSPDFASNGVALMTVNYDNVSPGSSACKLLWTADSGETWAGRHEVSSYGGCFGLTFVSDDSRSAIWAASSRSGVSDWLISRDGGETRAHMVPREFYSGPPPPVVVAKDGTIFHPGRGGVWSLGPGLPAPP